MKNRIKDVFNVENAVRIYRERPLALLSALFAVLSLYSVLSLFMLTDCPVEKKLTEGTTFASTEALEKRSLSLQGKIAALEERAGAGSLSRVFASIPFGFAGNEPSIPSMAEAPPLVRVKALGERGSVRVALIDVASEESKLVCEKDEFGSAGRIVRIDDDGVTWIWGSKKFRSLIWE